MAKRKPVTVPSNVYMALKYSKLYQAGKVALWYKAKGSRLAWIDNTERAFNKYRKLGFVPVAEAPDEAHKAAKFMLREYERLTDGMLETPFEAFETRPEKPKRGRKPRGDSSSPSPIGPSVAMDEPGAGSPE